MIVCLTGMHRSGTSLMSSYLEACGISMGDSLLGGKIGNRFGFFEDEEFLEFHKHLLRKNWSFLYLPKKTLHVSEADRRHARELCATNSGKYANWGWKDPRTTLFLDMWSECCGSLRFLLVYRQPYAVVDSLCRRLVESQSPYAGTMPFVGCMAWLTYNKRMLEFYKRNRKRCLLMNLSGFIHDHEIHAQTLKGWLGIDSDAAFSEVYRPAEMGRESGNAGRTLFARYVGVFYAWFRPRLEATYAELEEVAAIPGP